MKSNNIAALILIIGFAAVIVWSFAGCANLTPNQQAQITVAENTLALAAQIAAPLAGNQKISNDLYAVAAVASAYGHAPVPVNILQATTPLAGVVGTVLPLVTNSNSPNTQAVISGAAAILAQQSP